VVALVVVAPLGASAILRFANQLLLTAVQR
jgi:type III secretion protein S